MPSNHRLTDKIFAMLTESNCGVSARSISRLQPRLRARSILCGHKAVLLIKKLAWLSSKRLEIDVSGAKHSKTRMMWEDKKHVRKNYSTKSITFYFKKYMQN